MTKLTLTCNPRHREDRTSENVFAQQAMLMYFFLLTSHKSLHCTALSCSVETSTLFLLSALHLFLFKLIFVSHSRSFLFVSCLVQCLSRFPESQLQYVPPWWPAQSINHLLLTVRVGAARPWDNGHYIISTRAQPHLLHIVEIHFLFPSLSFYLLFSQTKKLIPCFTMFTNQGAHALSWAVSGPSTVPRGTKQSR